MTTIAAHTALSLSQLGAALGISKQAAHAAAKRGMPIDSVDAAKAWRLINVDAGRAKGFRLQADRLSPPLAQAPVNPADKPDADSGDDTEPAIDDAADYRIARTLREQINAQRAQLELDQLRGRLIDVDDARRVAFTSFRAIRDSVLAVPARVAAQAAAEGDTLTVEQLIEAALVDALGRFSPAKLLQDSSDADDAGE